MAKSIVDQSLILCNEAFNLYHKLFMAKRAYEDVDGLSPWNATSARKFAAYQRYYVLHEKALRRLTRRNATHDANEEAYRESRERLAM